MTPRSQLWLCRAVLGAAVLVVLPLTAPAAWAAPPAGGVSTLGCVQNTGGSACSTTGAALDGVTGVSVSPDGANVYVASANNKAIAIFNRSPGGSLSYSGCVKDPASGISCATSVDGLDGPRAVAASPDGTNVYVSSFDATPTDVFLTLDRGPDGALSDGASCFAGAGGPGGCWGIGSFNDPRGIAFGPGGDTVYVAATASNGIARFNRAAGGDLTLGSTVVTGKLNAPYRVAISSDGANAYTAGTANDTVVWFARNPADGSLSLPASCLMNPPGGGGCIGMAEGLDGAQGVAVSPDGANVYVASPVQDTVALFNRGLGGALSPAGCIKDPASAAPCSATAPGLNGAADLAVSPDGENVYVISQSPGNSVVAFSRGVGGSLIPINCVENTGGSACGVTAPALDTPQALAISPDGLNIYVTAFVSDAVSWFARNRAPACTGASAETAAATPVSVPLPCLDANGDSLIRAIASAPASGSLGAIDQATGTVTYTPNMGFTGTDSFTFTGSDGGATSSPAAATISVGPGPAGVAVLSDLTVKPKRFRRGSHLPTLAKRKRSGATIRFNLSYGANVELTFDRKQEGRRVGKRCRRPRPNVRRRPRCVRYVSKGILPVEGHAGQNKLRFEGRLSRRKTLPAGRYRLTAVPTNSAGTRGASSDTSFTLLSPARRR